MSLKPTASMPKTDRDWDRFCLESHDLNLLSGFGSPEGVVPSSPGRLYLNKNGGTGTTLYKKETGTGNTGWIAV
jgi:hypothetical protein